MGKAGCSVKLTKFKWNRAGYAEAMNASAVQSTIKRKADVVKASADAGIRKSGGHYSKQFNGNLSKGYVVGTQSFEARYGQAKDKTLTKALGGAGGDS